MLLGKQDFDFAQCNILRTRGFFHNVRTFGAKTSKLFNFMMCPQGQQEKG